MRGFFCGARMRMATVLAIGLVCGRVSAAGQGVIVITGGTVMPIASPPIERGTVVIRDGKIVGVGRDLVIPSGATVVDATGKFVLPGLVDAMSYYGLDEAELNETPSPLTPDLRILEEYAPFGAYQLGKEGPLRATDLLSGGVTTQYIAPGDRTVIGGQGAVVKTAAANFAGLVVREPAAIDITLGEQSVKVFRQSGRSPATRMAAVSQLRQALVRAREYAERARAYEALGAAQRRTRPAPPRDLGLEALGRLLRRELPARVQANCVTEIHAAMQLAEEFGFDLIIDSGASAHSIASELASRRIPVVLPPISHPYVSGEEVADKSDYLDPSPRSPAKLREAGVNIAIASFSRAWGTLGRWTGRWLLLNAVIAGGHGLSDADILRSVTLGPAEILGVADRVGSLEVGKDADVIILDGSPFSVKSWVERVYVNGESVYVRAPRERRR